MCIRCAVQFLTYVVMLICLLCIRSILIYSSWIRGPSKYAGTSEILAVLAVLVPFSFLSLMLFAGFLWTTLLVRSVLWSR